MVQCDDELIHRNAEILCGSLDYADVRLMRNEPVDVLGSDSGFVSGEVERLGQSLGSEFVHLSAVLIELVQTLLRETVVKVAIYLYFRSDINTSCIEKSCTAAVCAEVRGILLVAALYYGSSSTVSEEYA